MKVESTGRPDSARKGPGRFFDLLNGGKASVALDLRSSAGRDSLRRLVAALALAVVASRALAGVLPAAGDGFGCAWFDMAPLQNGPADGLALVDPSGAVVEFLSWEGVVTPGEGPALGIASTDIGSSEGSSTALGDSLQRVGTGGAGADFSWAAPAAHTRAAVNTGQVLVLAVGVPSLSPVALLGLAGLLLAAAAPRVRRAARGRRSRP